MLYNALATWDIRQTVTWLRKTFQNRPLFGLGEEGPGCVLKAAVVCSNPLNLEIASKVLQASLVGREIYLRYMGSMLT